MRCYLVGSYVGNTLSYNVFCPHPQLGPNQAPVLNFLKSEIAQGAFKPRDTLPLRIEPLAAHEVEIYFQHLNSSCIKRKRD